MSSRSGNFTDFESFQKQITEILSHKPNSVISQSISALDKKNFDSFSRKVLGLMLLSFETKSAIDITQMRIFESCLLVHRFQKILGEIQTIINDSRFIKLENYDDVFKVTIYLLGICIKSKVIFRGIGWGGRPRRRNFDKNSPEITFKAK